MQNFLAMIQNITPEIYQELKLAVEIGKWSDGRKLTQEQKEISLMAMIAWEQKNLPEEQRTGYMGGQACASQSKKLADVDDSLFAPAAGTLH